MGWLKKIDCRASGEADFHSTHSFSEGGHFYLRKRGQKS